VGSNPTPAAQPCGIPLNQSGLPPAADPLALYGLVAEGTRFHALTDERLTNGKTSKGRAEHEAGRATARSRHHSLDVRRRCKTAAVVESPGYEAVQRVAQEHDPAWLGVIRVCHDAIEKQVTAGGDDYTCAKWVKNLTGVQVSSLRPLVTWGVLEHKRWGSDDLDTSGRRYYLMPDRSGVRRALLELGA
jgi:hypothetical protein